MVFLPTEDAQNAFLKAWIELRIGLSLGDCKCLGIFRDGRLCAVAAYSNYRVVDIELSLAADNPRWATKQVFAWILSYPFVNLKTQRITAMVKKSNRRCRKLLEGVGFMLEGRHLHAAKNLETMFSYGMTREYFLKRYLDKPELLAVAV